MAAPPDRPQGPWQFVLPRTLVPAAHARMAVQNGPRIRCMHRLSRAAVLSPRGGTIAIVSAHTVRPSVPHARAGSPRSLSAKAFFDRAHAARLQKKTFFDRLRATQLCDASATTKPFLSQPFLFPLRHAEGFRIRIGVWVRRVWDGGPGCFDNFVLRAKNAAQLGAGVGKRRTGDRRRILAPPRGVSWISPLFFPEGERKGMN